ncbi:hypothetical protein A3I45_03330 [Candidatus Uhrbacteria bacterium RIFCSPLOWO2_02_FULL_53_10]|uniref:Nudix hydrolase domain-containing protein n=1 Tax=Candidatus Uhrbacteria bacterium RIFCSPLOWO2_02_FULL_53_10 TaxID=1802411 RepID=A0A1F7VF10_9BACT|nr:MAG: hypothetical protein A3I45_03330 [Candidatus Uhrbacteria bacterium RIFCSPLOWO2_02_FULL_53_10]
MNLIIVNENDEEIGVKDRADLNPKTDIYRVSALWVLNGRGEVLLAQRAHDKTVSRPLVGVGGRHS